MYNTSLRILNNVAEAEDVMQEAFLDAFRNLGSFRAEVTFGAWLKKIVIHKSISAVRKRKIFEPLEEAKSLIAEEETEVFSESRYCRIEQIREAFNHLDEPSRIILSLHLLEGYNHKEIAEILGVTHNAIRTRYVRAKQRLLEIINNSQVNLLKN